MAGAGHLAWIQIQNEKEKKKDRGGREQVGEGGSVGHVDRNFPCVRSSGNSAFRRRTRPFSPERPWPKACVVILYMYTHMINTSIQLSNSILHGIRLLRYYPLSGTCSFRSHGSLFSRGL